MADYCKLSTMEIVRKLGIPYIPLKPSLIAQVSNEQVISQVTGPIKEYADLFGLNALRDILFTIKARDIIVRIGNETKLADLEVSGTVEAVTLRADALISGETEPTNLTIVFKAVASDGTVIDLAQQGENQLKDLVVRYMNERYHGAVIVVEGCARSNGYVCERPTNLYSVYFTISDIASNGWKIELNLSALSPQAKDLEAFNVYLYLIEKGGKCEKRGITTSSECLQYQSNALMLLHYLKVFSEIADEIETALETMTIAFGAEDSLKDVTGQLISSQMRLAQLNSIVYEIRARLEARYTPILTVWINAGKRFPIVRGKGLTAFARTQPYDINVVGRLTLNVDDLLERISSLASGVFSDDPELVTRIVNAVKQVVTANVPITGSLPLAIQLQLASGVFTVIALRLANIANKLDEKRLKEILLNISEIAISYAKADNVLIETFVTYENGGSFDAVIPSYLLVGETSDVVDMGLGLLNKLLTANLLDKELGIKKVNARIVSPSVLDFSDVTFKGIQAEIAEYIDYGTMYKLRLSLDGIKPEDTKRVEELVQGRGVSLLQWAVRIGDKFYPAVLTNENERVILETYLPKVGVVESTVEARKPFVIDVFPVVLGIEAEYFQPNPILKIYQVGSGIIRLDLLREGYTKVYGWDLEVIGVVDLGGRADIFYLLLTSDYGTFNKKGLKDGLRVWGYLPYVTNDNKIARIYLDVEIGDKNSIRKSPVDNEGDLYVEGTISLAGLNESVFNVSSSPQVNILDIVERIATEAGTPLTSEAFKFTLVRAIPRFVYVPAGRDENPFPTVTLINTFYPYIVYYSADDLLSFAKVYVTNVRSVIADVEPIISDVVQTEGGRETIVFAPIAPQVINNKVELSTTGTALAPVNIKILRQGNKYVLDVVNNEVVLKVPEDSNFSGIKVVLMDEWGRPLLLGKLLEDLLDEFYAASLCVKAVEKGESVDFEFERCPRLTNKLIEKNGKKYIIVAGRQFSAKQVGVLKQMALLFEKGIDALGISFNMERGFYFDAKKVVDVVNGSTPTKWSFYSVVVFAPIVFKFLDALKQKLSQQISAIDTVTQDIMFAFKELSAIYIFREPPYAIIKNASVNPEIPLFKVEFSGSQTTKVVWGARIWIDAEGGGASVYVSGSAKPGDVILLDPITEAYKQLVRETPHLYQWLSERVPNIDSILDSLEDIGTRGLPSELLRAFATAIEGRDPLEIIQLTPIERAILMGYVPKIVRIRLSFEGAYVRAWKDQNGVTLDVVDNLNAFAFVVDLGTKDNELKALTSPVDTNEYRTNKRIYIASMDNEFSAVEVDRFIASKIDTMTLVDLLHSRWIEIFSGLNVLHMRSTEQQEQTYYGFSTIDLVNLVPYAPLKRGESQLPDEALVKGTLDLGNFFESIEGVAYVKIQGIRRQVYRPFSTIPLDVEYLKVLRPSDKTIPTPTVFDEIDRLEVFLGTVDGFNYWAKVPVISNEEGEVRAYLPFTRTLHELKATIQPLRETPVKFPIGKQPLRMDIAFSTSFFAEGTPTIVTLALSPDSGVLNELLSLKAGDTYLYEIKPVVFLGTVEESGGLIVKTRRFGSQQITQIEVPSALVRTDIVPVFRPRTNISYAVGDVFKVELNTKDDIALLPFEAHVYRDGIEITQSMPNSAIVTTTAEGKKYIFLYSLPSGNGTQTMTYTVEVQKERVRLIQYLPFIVFNSSSRVTEFRENDYLKRSTSIVASAINAPPFLFKAKNPGIVLALTGISASGVQVLNARIPLTQPIFELEVDERFTAKNGGVALDVQTKIIGTDDKEVEKTIEDLFKPENLFVPVAYAGILTAEYEVELEEGGKLTRAFTLSTSSTRLPLPAVDVTGKENEIDVNVLSWATPVRKITAVLTLVNSANDIRHETICLVPPIAKGGFKLGEPLNSVLLATVSLSFNEALTRIVVVGGSAPNVPTVIYTSNSAVNLLNDVVVLTNNVEQALAGIAVAKTTNEIVFKIGNLEEAIQYLESGTDNMQEIDEYVKNVARRFAVKEEYVKEALYNVLVALAGSWYVLASPVKVQLEYIIGGEVPSGVQLSRKPKQLADVMVLDPLESVPLEGKKYRFVVTYIDMRVLRPLELPNVKGSSEVSIMPFLPRGFTIDKVCNVAREAVASTNIRPQEVQATQGLTGVSITVAEEILKLTGNDPTKNAMVLASLLGLVVLSTRVA